MGKEITMDPVQEWGDESDDGVLYSVTLRRIPVEQSQGSFVQYKTIKVRSVKAATLERLVSLLLEPGTDPHFTTVFLSTYRAFTTTQQLLEMVLDRASSFDGNNNDDNADQTGSGVCKSTLSSLLSLWLGEFSEDFRDPPHHSCLLALRSHLRRDLQLRWLCLHAEKLLRSFSASESCCGNQFSFPLSGQEVENYSSPGRWDFLTFPSRDVAEELTRLDADLFVKAIPFQCLGCVWSQRDKKENKHLAATIRATISQFNSVTNCVISTLLRQPAPPPVRASVIEKWIRVAQECRALKNLSSLRAILSALQSNSIFRLKKTWAAVSRESLSIFEQLSEMFPGENCSLSGCEILLQSPGCGAVPYLGTYLTALTMLDSALPDTVQGGLINFEKRRRECEVLSQIRQLQGSCLQYKLNDHPEISSWLRSYKRLSERESYDLSQEVEPPVDSYPASTGTWNHRTLAKKMIWLLTGSEGPGSKSSPDLVSLTSSGSNGSETEDLTIPSSPRRAKHMVRPWALSGSSRDVCHDAFSSSEPSSPLPFPHPLQHCRSASMTSLPVYNQQIDDSCIVRVSVESSNGNLYKSILLTSQDKTLSVIQRALQKHNVESVRSEDFQLSQVLPGGKELIIPDKANVFYAMCTSADYNFILKRRRGHKTPPTPTAGWKK
ncbi:ral guanine nucleotide dissociation stimulator-like 1 isoform X2 [Acipenser oxyrinchus oxyrinchus]|uniref:Ral guanine nucleotide dissociation stimulator-like 1 isoform X2 n=1 Tax=Acipenser oxyrinchus oxyrinchus TaxID=40147 RepID=A0AAD8FS87_ACIOX|nr:ral guanine nucleotide dissociation stimulator-like 1 isoform X2 [Acipenser oxyrinchus oxyrinchus]